MAGYAATEQAVQEAPQAWLDDIRHQALAAGLPSSFRVTTSCGARESHERCETMGQNVTVENTLIPKQRKALEPLLTHAQVAAAARATGVSRQTLYRWLAEPAFAGVLREAEALALDGLSRTLARLSEKEAGAVEAALDDPDASHSVKIRGFDVETGRRLQVLELVTIEQRLAAVEHARDVGWAGQPRAVGALAGSG